MCKWARPVITQPFITDKIPSVTDFSNRDSVTKRRTSYGYTMHVNSPKACHDPNGSEEVWNNCEALDASEKRI
jgi:hypothetical protein